MNTISGQRTERTTLANLSTLHLKIINHNLRLNDQAKHWIKNTRTKEENGRCTSLTRTRTSGNYEQETYKHFFLECNTTVAIINYATKTFKVSKPNLKINGELIIYNFNQKNKTVFIKLKICQETTNYQLIIICNKKT